MREYYGSVRQCREYINDENHKAIAWKEHPFSFKLENSTNYTLVAKRRGATETIKAGDTTQILCKEWWDGEMQVSIKEKPNVKCDFIVERGCMIERGVTKKSQRTEENIAPVFKDGKVVIVTCKYCGPNLGVVLPKYNITPLKAVVNEVIFENRTPYDIIISYHNNVIQRILKRKKDKISRVRTGIPYFGTLYFDTEEEEIFYQSKYDKEEKKILRVNGCCMEIEYGEYKNYHSIIGPAEGEPYVRHLGVFKESDKVFSIWCNTIDYRLD